MDLKAALSEALSGLDRVGDDLMRKRLRPDEYVDPDDAGGEPKGVEVSKLTVGASPEGEPDGDETLDPELKAKLLALLAQ